MHQDHLFRRRLRLSQFDVLRAWTESDLLGLWFWPGADDTVYVPVTGRGDAYRISSASRGVTFSGVCLDLNAHGFDLTWHIEGMGFEHDGFDTLSVRLFPGANGGTELALSYAVNSEISDRLAQLWGPTLDRLADLDPALLGHDLGDYGYQVA